MATDLAWREKAREEYRSTHGKFNSPMAALMFDRLLDGGDGERSWSNPDWGSWAEQYGRRILHSDNRGFITLVKFATPDEALAWAKAEFPDEDEEESDGD
jgi:hypothetical protein